MRKRVLSMPIKFEIDSLICSRVETAAIFENVCFEKNTFIVAITDFFYDNISDPTVILQFFYRCQAFEKRKKQKCDFSKLSH